MQKICAPGLLIFESPAPSPTAIAISAISRPILLWCLLAFLPGQHASAESDLLQRDQRDVRPMLVGNLDRPLRYTPDHGDFVITNGPESFNRPLYGGSSAFRVDGGDRPEFSFYLPGRGGNLRLGISTATGTKWLNSAASIIARYRPGSMLHEIRDPLLGNGALQITALAPRAPEGLIVRVETQSLANPVDLVFAFGGITGERGSRDGDIGTERVPVREFFRPQPEYSRDNEVTLGENFFVVRGKGGSLAGILPTNSLLNIGDAALWENPAELLALNTNSTTTLPLVVGRVRLVPGQPVLIALQHLTSKQKNAEVLATYREVAAGREIKTDSSAESPPWKSGEISAVFARAEADRQSVAGRVSVQTPDPYLDAAVAALIIAADGVWDDRQSAYLHGGVAWRVRLLGWRVSCAGDALGWHERTRAHFDSYAAQQNVAPIADAIPPSEASAHLARNETALHSNGDLTKSHYDMNLLGVDAIFRHLLWTGDLDYARKIWPVIERHLAWERRLFRREYGPEKLPLYEAYCCIWASDALSYNGGGATHSTAFNLLHNRLAARVAKLLGADPAIYEREAALIERGLREQLWLKDRGWFAEWKDLLSLQLLHPSAAAWTFYHTVDSGVPSPLEAWQMSRQVECELPHFPVRGPGVPAGNYTISTTTWMPYIWSINNVVLAESVHTALALWEAGRREAAYPLLKGALLDSMYLGITPGNVGMCTWFDVNRRESQRDFGDGIGALARTVVEGVFGVSPDLLANEVRLRPGFPSDWNHAQMHHPDFDFAFARTGETDRYVFESRFPRPVAIRLQIAAQRDDVATVTVNGQPAAWRAIAEAVGTPQIEIQTPSAAKNEVTISWRGQTLAPVPVEKIVSAGAEFDADAGATITGLADPQTALSNERFFAQELRGTVTGVPGHRTVFARVSQGKLSWWQPLALEVRPAHPAAPQVFTTDWTKPLPPEIKLDPVPLAGIFNDQVAQIFRHDYVSPRPPPASLGVPRQGFGFWTAPAAAFGVDDSGVRSAARKNDGFIHLPNGVPLRTPGEADARNVAFVSQWDNFPREVTAPLAGRASKIFLLMAGSTWALQSRIENGEIVVTYADGSTARLALENPTTWWPIDQDYFVDDFAFRREGGFPLRVDLKTGNIRILDLAACQNGRREISGGAATVLDFSLDPLKELKSLTVRAVANEVIVGLMSATLQRP